MPLLRPLDSYPQSQGSVLFGIFPHRGPTSYAPVVIESSPLPVVGGGGDLVYASEIGMKVLDKVVGGITDDGLYEVKGIPVSRSDFLSGASQPTYRLQWFVVATGAEVADEFDLSDSIVRLDAVGRY